MFFNSIKSAFGFITFLLKIDQSPFISFHSKVQKLIFQISNSKNI